MKQKFRKLTFVRVADEMPNHMSHFPSGVLGVVDGTFSQIYGGADVASYAIFIIKEGEVVNRVSWYHEKHLSACEKQDALLAEELIEAYNLSS